MSQPTLESIMGTVQAQCEDSTKTGNCDFASNYFGSTSICSAVDAVLYRDSDGVFSDCSDELSERDIDFAKEFLPKKTRFGTLAPKVQEIFLSIFTARWERINQVFTEDGFEFKCPEEERPNLRMNIMVAAVTMIENMVALNDAQPHEGIMAKFEKQKKIVDLLEQFDLSTFHLVEANLALIEGEITKTQVGKLLRVAANLHPETVKPNLEFQDKEFKALLTENIKLNGEVRRLEREGVISLENVKLLLQLDFKLLEFLIKSLVKYLTTNDKSSVVIEEFLEKVSILTQLEGFCEAGLLSIDRLHNEFILTTLLTVGKVYGEKMPSFLKRIDELVQEKKMSLILAKDLKNQLRRYEHPDILSDVEREILLCEESSNPLEWIVEEIQVQIDQCYLTAQEGEAIKALLSVDEMHQALALNKENGERLVFNFEG